MEIKYGFVPNSQDASAWRVRRRYRLVKGGHPHVTLVHYSRGPAIRESRFCQHLAYLERHANVRSYSHSHLACGFSNSSCTGWFYYYTFKGSFPA
jgi:hypothetical protein